MRIELKKAILDWLIENEHAWQRTNACVRNFSNYIYDNNGYYIIGGKEVVDFIHDAEKLIWG